MNKNQRWIKIAGINEDIFDKKVITTVDVEGQKVCIIKTTKGLKACSSLCPHASGDLSEGFLDKKENIVCPVHGYHFNLDHGRDTNNEGYFLKIFRVKENEDGVFVEMS
jgi:3-phenylpropionate/trans-cinnamate dioxygenase ferredoxin subunit